MRPRDHHGLIPLIECDRHRRPFRRKKRLDVVPKVRRQKQRVARPDVALVDVANASGCLTARSPRLSCRRTHDAMDRQVPTITSLVCSESRPNASSYPCRGLVSGHPPCAMRDAYFRPRSTGQKIVLRVPMSAKVSSKITVFHANRSYDSVPGPVSFL